MSQIDVSVIITSKNEEQNIRNCLNSIKLQSYPQERIEIIVVDNNSTDGTKIIASHFASRVFNQGPERAAQRNFGIARAYGEYILYLDADMSLSKNVISECVHKCKKKNIVALYVPERIIGKGFWIKVRDFERGFYTGTCIDVVRFMRTKTARKTGGFDVSLTGPEDWDFDRRIRKYGTVDIIKSPLYHNEGIFNLPRYLSKKRYYSGDFSRYINKWGRGDKIIQKQLGLRYRYFGVFFEKGKIFNLLRHPILAAGMYGLRFLVGLNYILS